MLDPLSDPCAADDVGTFRQGRVRVPSADDGVRKHIGLMRVDLRRSLFHRLFGIEHRLQDLVVHLHQCSRFSRRSLVIGSHRSHHISDTANFFANRDEPRPVIMDEAVPTIPGNVRCGRHRRNARETLGLTGVDPHHAGSGRRRKDDRTVEQSRSIHVIDIRLIAQSELRGGESDQRATHPPVSARLGYLFTATSSGHQLDSIDDLHVSRATAQMTGESTGDLVSTRTRVLIEEPLGLKSDSWYAVSALEPRSGRKTLGHECSLVFVNPLKRQNLGPVNPFRRHRATDLGIAID